MSQSLRVRLALMSLAAALLAGCSQMPTVGPSRKEVADVADRPGGQAVQIVDVDDAVARRLKSLRTQQLFSDSLGSAASPAFGIGTGDAVEINLWEAPPAALFGSGVPDARGVPGSVRTTTLPTQVVDHQGFISVPFAGRIHAAGMTPMALEDLIVKRLKGKANQPEAMVRVVQNTSSKVTVVGEVANSLRMPLTASGERLLDALAAAGGVRQPINKMTLQVTRGSDFYSMPLDLVIRDPKQNVPLRAGDVVTAIFQPLSFTALGSTGKNDEVNFEAQGITLAQALARSGGLVDSRSDPKGVFIFRMEQPNALDWPNQPVATTPDGLVPVVYRIDLKNPSSFFVMQSFAMNNKDVLFISNAPSAELQKFLNMVFSVVFPVLNVIQVTK